MHPNVYNLPIAKVMVCYSQSTCYIMSLHESHDQSLAHYKAITA